MITYIRNELRKRRNGEMKWEVGERGREWSKEGEDSEGIEEGREDREGERRRGEGVGRGRRLRDEREREEGEAMVKEKKGRRQR